MANCPYCFQGLRTRPMSRVETCPGCGYVEVRPLTPLGMLNWLVFLVILGVIAWKLYARFG